MAAFGRLCGGGGRATSRGDPVTRGSPLRSAVLISGELFEGRLVLFLSNATNAAAADGGSLRKAVEQARRRAGSDSPPFNPVAFLRGTKISLTPRELKFSDATGQTAIDGGDASVTLAGSPVCRVVPLGAKAAVVFSVLTVSRGPAVLDGREYTSGNGLADAAAEVSILTAHRAMDSLKAIAGATNQGVEANKPNA